VDDPVKAAVPIAIAICVIAALSVSPAHPAQTAATDATAFAGSDGALAFIRRGRSTDIWRAESDATELRRITDSAGAIEFGPAWSPDGRRIAFFASTSGSVSAQVFVTAAHGRGAVPRRLTRGTSENDSPAWSPDGTRLVFAVDVPRSSQWHLDVMNANGTQRRTLLSVRARLVSDPAWSPDGRRIVYSLDHQLYLTSSSHGGRGNRVTQGDEPNWAPDGKHLAFRRDQRAFVINADGSGERPVAPDLKLKPPAGPVWSPSGSFLAMAVEPGPICGDPRFFESAIAIVKSDGTDARLLFGCNTAYDGDPDWQPACTIYGTDANDILKGTAGPDVICGLRGDDRIAALAGDDVVIGGDGNDIIYGGAGQDRLFGSAGRDRLFARGDGSRDVVNGGPGSDSGTVDATDLRAELEAG
jgi:dipeptidyl aminopeptidase/acylaminoacyl peptidase